MPRAPKTVKKISTLFPAGRFGRMLRQGRFSDRVSKNAGPYMAATVGYLVRELFEVTAKGMGKKKKITPRHVNVAVRTDEELGELLKDVCIASGGVVGGVNPALEKNKGKTVKSTKKAAKKATATKKAAKITTKKAGKKAPAKKSAAPTLTKQDSTVIGGVTVGGATLTRTQSGKVEEMARVGRLSHKWQYQADNGKFMDYDTEASGAVEIAYASWQLDSHIDVRSVASGDWEYMVDFNLMQQQNVKHHAHKIRKIRRVPL